MFDGISGVYDPMNLLISAFQEPRWRRRAVALTRLGPGGRAIDIATGTGKVAADLHRRAQPGGEVLGVDISPGMIGVAERRFEGRPGLTFVVGDALALPAPDAAFDAATIAFGMRNLPDYGQGFAEMRRVVRPGGRVVCLEIARPRSRLARSSAHGSTGSCRSSAAWPDRAAPTPTSSAASVTTLRRRRSPASCATQASSG